MGYVVRVKDMYLGVFIGMGITVFWNMFLKNSLGGFEGAVIGMLFHGVYFGIKSYAHDKR